MKLSASAKIISMAAAAVVVLGGAGCGAKARKEITSLQRNQAANYLSEAQFAMTLRDYARAEPLLLKAAETCPDNGEYWMLLGQTRMRLGQRDGAKTAYKRALGAFEDDAAQSKTDPQPVLQQVTTLALLGRADDARKLLESLPGRFPDNRMVRSQVEGKILDRMLADPKFKELSL